MLSDFPESSRFSELLWTRTDYFCIISQILTIFQRYLNSDSEETDKKINQYLVSTYEFRKDDKISNSDRSKKLTLLKFFYPYGRMLHFGTIKPLGTEELFSQQQAHFWYLHADRTRSTPENNCVLSRFQEPAIKG